VGKQGSLIDRRLLPLQNIIYAQAIADNVFAQGCQLGTFPYL